LTALGLAGCGHHPDDQPAGEGHAHGVETGVSFNSKYGLLVPPATAKFIGLEVADVAERKVTSAFRFAAQVYRAASETSLASTQALAARSTLASGIVSTTQAALWREGQPVTVTFAGTDTFKGRLTSLNRRVETTSEQVEVLLAVDDVDARLTRGALVSVTVPLVSAKGVVGVPRAAILHTTEGDFIYTLSGERFVRAAVKLGVVNQEFAEVTDGLLEGDKIVVKPVMTLWLAELQSIRGGKACADGH
jgi:hypothetical protein